MSDQRTGQADTAPQAHINAVARVLAFAGVGSVLNGDAPRKAAGAVLDSTDPAVHAALLDALTRRGVLTEERQSVANLGGTKRRLVTRWEPTP